jgi:hypothetical protein
MDNLQDQRTRRYIQENELIYSTPLAVYDQIIPKWYTPYIPKIVIDILKVVKGLGTYIFWDLIIGRRFIAELIEKHNSRKNKYAIAIGLGPSIGQMSLNQLRSFRLNGGEIWCVNGYFKSCFAEVEPDFYVLSDPANFSFGETSMAELNSHLWNYIKKCKQTTVVCPIRFVEVAEKMLGGGRAIGFSDSECRALGMTSPIFPRGYLSMTLFKAIACASWFGYQTVYVLGLDNTYCKQIFCDKNNRLIRLEERTGEPAAVEDVTNQFLNMGNYHRNMANLFSDLYLFGRTSKIVNLDIYSLVDAFEKVSLKSVMGES